MSLGLKGLIQSSVALCNGNKIISFTLFYTMLIHTFVLIFSIQSLASYADVLLAHHT